LKLFDIVKEKFEREIEESGKKIPLSFVTLGFVDHRKVIIVYVYVSEETPVCLPSEFEGFPVLIAYGVDLDLHHRSFHKDLKPGISIGSSSNPPDACTLGGLFQNTAEPSKKYILTVKHGVGKNDDGVFQPEKFEEVYITQLFLCNLIC